MAPPKKQVCKRGHDDWREYRSADRKQLRRECRTCKNRHAQVKYWEGRVQGTNPLLGRPTRESRIAAMTDEEELAYHIRQQADEMRYGHTIWSRASTWSDAHDHRSDLSYPEGWGDTEAPDHSEIWDTVSGSVSSFDPHYPDHERSWQSWEMDENLTQDEKDFLGVEHE